jgi:hypothetical protein
MPCAIVERNNGVGEDQEDRHRDGRSPDSTYGIAVYAEPALCNLDLVAGTTVAQNLLSVANGQGNP